MPFMTGATYLQDGAAVFQASFQALKESSTVHKGCPFRELTFNGRQVSAHNFAALLPLCNLLNPPNLAVLREWGKVEGCNTEMTAVLFSEDVAEMHLVSLHAQNCAAW